MTKRRHIPLGCPWLRWLLLLALVLGARADDFAARCADRAAVERVYYLHRTGDKPAFEATLPQAALERLVRLDLKKEQILRERYQIAITPALLEAEVRRITTTTRAPEVLAEIRAALGADPDRFATAVARPNLVEHLLRDKFENDDRLHAANRQACETVRTSLLVAKTNGAAAAQLIARLRQSNPGRVTETTWVSGAPASPANTLASPVRGGSAEDRPRAFGDLPASLRSVLRAQLRQAGDVSAVIELPTAYLLYVAREKTEAQLTAACLALPKRDYETWLDER